MDTLGEDLALVAFAYDAWQLGGVLAASELVRLAYGGYIVFGIDRGVEAVEKKKPQDPRLASAQIVFSQIREVNPSANSPFRPTLGDYLSRARPGIPSFWMMLNQPRFGIVDDYLDPLLAQGRINRSNRTRSLKIQDRDRLLEIRDRLDGKDPKPAAAAQLSR